MAKAAERTSFTKDVQGRYLCNDITEVNAWKSSGGRPFDIIIGLFRTHGLPQRHIVRSRVDAEFVQHTQELRNTPRLSDAAAGSIRRIAVEHFCAIPPLTSGSPSFERSVCSVRPRAR
jgi:hypothetical protein